ncbi:MAG: hypothetical protein WKF79_14275 [Nocardioides sp.]
MTDLPDTPFTTSDLDDLVLSRGQLRRLIDQRVVRRVLQTVYVRADIEDTQTLRARCAALAVPPHHVVADRSAAWIHGVECFDYSELALVPRLEMVAIGGHDRTERPEVFGGKRDLTPADICEIAGVLVTTPLRTACDLGCLLSRNQALGVLDAFRRLHGLEEADFARILPRYVRRRGVIQLRELVAYSSPLPESQPESWTRGVIIDEQFPAPQPQVWVFVEDIGWVRLDMAYEHLKIAVEYDGEEFHREPEDREADRRRRAALRAAGWIVIVVRKDGFSGPAREAWLGELLDALRERTPAVPSKRRYSRGDSSAAYPRRRRSWR